MMEQLLLDSYYLFSQASSSVEVGRVWWFVGLVFVVVVGLGIGGWMVLRKDREKREVVGAFGMMTLEVRLPKQTREEEEVQRTEKELVGVAEQLYANLSGIDRRKEHVAFELVSVGGEISMFVSLPARLYSLVEKQIHAQYPSASIEHVEGHQIFMPGGEVVAGEMRLRKQDVLPLTTYKELEADPLNALGSVLAKLDEGEGAAIQLVIRPAKKSWYSRGSKIARDMVQGKGLDVVTRGWPSKAMAAVGKGLGELFRRKDSDSANSMMPKPADEPRRLTQFEEEMVRKIEEKASRQAFESVVRVVVSSPMRGRGDVHVRNIANSFAQLNSAELNSFVLWSPRGKRARDRLIRAFILKSIDAKRQYVLSTPELVSVFHFPTRLTDIPALKRLEAKAAPAPVGLPSEGVLLGENVYRGVVTPVRLSRDDRRRHMYVIGKTGVGKTTILKNMAAQDILAGEGVCVVDPHGDFIEDMLAVIPKERAEDVILFDPGDTERPMALNMLEYKTPEQKDFVVDEMIAIFHKLFPPEIVGPMFEHNMRNVMLTLMADPENPGTIAEIPRMFTDQEFQAEKVAKVTDPVVRDFWEKEMAQTSDFHKSEMLGYLVSKVGQFVENGMMRNIIGQQKSAFDVREVMDEGKILLVNLSKGKTGEINSALLGLIMVSKIQMAAMGRANIPEDQRRDFYLYIDEFQNFVTDSIATILSEARKYKLNLVMAHQYVAQLARGEDTKVRDAVFGNVGSMVSFKIGASDAEFLEREFEPVFSQSDLINIERFNAYAKIMVNGQTSKPFSMKMFDFSKQFELDVERGELIRRLARFKFGRDKAGVESEIFGRGRDSVGAVEEGVDTELNRRAQNGEL